MTKIWGLHRITGYWTPLRESELSEADQWLAIFAKYQSDTYSEFKASLKRPRYAPSRFDAPRKGRK